MERNRIFAITSLLIGFIGFAIEYSIDIRMENIYEDMGGLGELVCLFRYSDQESFFLILFNLVGVILGVIAFVSYKKYWWALIGVGLSMFHMSHYF